MSSYKELNNLVSTGWKVLEQEIQKLCSRS